MVHYNICPYCNARVLAELFTHHTMDCESIIETKKSRTSLLPIPLGTKTQRNFHYKDNGQLVKWRSKNLLEQQQSEEITACNICGVKKSKNDIAIHASFCRERSIMAKTRPSMVDETIKCEKCMKWWSYLLINAHRLECCGIRLRPLEIPKPEVELLDCCVCNMPVPATDIYTHTNTCLDNKALFDSPASVASSEQTPDNVDKLQGKKRTTPCPIPNNKTDVELHNLSSVFDFMAVNYQLSENRDGNYQVPKNIGENTNIRQTSNAGRVVDKVGNTGRAVGYCVQDDKKNQIKFPARFDLPNTIIVQDNRLDRINHDILAKYLPRSNDVKKRRIKRGKCDMPLIIPDYQSRTDYTPPPITDYQPRKDITSSVTDYQYEGEYTPAPVPNYERPKGKYPSILELDSFLPCKTCGIEISEKEFNSHILVCKSFTIPDNKKQVDKFTIQGIILYAERSQCNMCEKIFVNHTEAMQHNTPCMTQSLLDLKNKLILHKIPDVNKYYCRVLEVFQLVPIYSVSGNRIYWPDVLQEVDSYETKDDGICNKRIHTLKTLCMKKMCLHTFVQLDLNSTLVTLKVSDRLRMYSLYLYCLIRLSEIIIDTTSIKLEDVYKWGLGTNTRVQLMNIYWSQRYPKIMNDYNLVFRLLDICISDGNYFLIDVIISNCLMFRLHNIGYTFIYLLENYGYMEKVVKMIVQDIIKKYNLLSLLGSNEYMKLNQDIRQYVDSCLTCI